MRSIFSARPVALVIVAAIPFVLLPKGLAWSVEPIARIAARWCNAAMPDFSRLAAASGAPAAPERGAAAPADDWANEETQGKEPAAIDGRAPLSNQRRTASPSGARASMGRLSIASMSGPMAAERAPARRARPNVFVGPDSIQRAIPAPGRPTSLWTNRTAEHPAGLLIQTPGALTGVIEAGDILVEAEGQTLASFEQLLVTVKQAYERRAKRLSGRLFRKGDLLPVTVEPGW